MVVPFPAGAATDISARIYAERLAALWGQPVVIDNKGGGNGIPAAESVARAKPDGLTIFATSAMTQVVNPAIYDKLPYDPISTSKPITRMGTSPFVLLVDRNSPINSAAELTAKLKAEPGKYNYGAGALPARVASELYKMAAGVDAVYVGYKSNPQAIPDVQSGLLTFMMIDTVNAKIAMERGALKGSVRHRRRALRRRARHADVRPRQACPTCSSRPGPASMCPKGTPREIVTAHQRRHPHRRGAAGSAGAARRPGRCAPKLMSPDEFAAFTRSEKERWGQIIRRANIKVE